MMKHWVNYNEEGDFCYNIIHHVYMYLPDKLVVGYFRVYLVHFNGKCNKLNEMIQNK